MPNYWIFCWSLSATCLLLHFCLRSPWLLLHLSNACLIVAGWWERTAAWLTSRARRLMTRARSRFR